MSFMPSMWLTQTIGSMRPQIDIYPTKLYTPGWIKTIGRQVWYSVRDTSSQLPHSYYFITHILVLKFTNKGVFFEEIQDSHFLRKRGYFGTHLREFGEKGGNFDVQCFTMKRGGSFGLKVCVLPQKKGVHLGLKSQCFIAKRGQFELKS